MGSSASRDCFDPFAPNTPLVGICLCSLLFNSVQGGVMRRMNLYSNIPLLYALGVSNAFYGLVYLPKAAAQIGFFSALYFTIAPRYKLLYTCRLFPRQVHYAIGGGYMAYHTYRYLEAVNEFEDAGEDVEDSI